MKLLFWPLFIYALVQRLFFKNQENYWCVKLAEILLGLVLILVLFYTYNGVFGKSPDWINIAIFYISINTFLAANLPGAKNASFGLFDLSNGISAFATVPLNIKMTSEKTRNHRSNERFYQRLQELEGFYGVLFKVPARDFTKTEKDTIDYLYEIREYGNLHLRFPDIPSSDFYVHNPSEISWIYELAKTGQFFAYKLSRKLMVELFGVGIGLGMCTITLKGARPKSVGEIEYKIKTWSEGDVRKIATEFPDGMDLWISPEKYQGQARETAPEELPMAVLPEDAQLTLSEDLMRIFVEY